MIDDDLDDETPAFKGEDPGASRRYRFRHPTASGKTIAAAGFVESAQHLGVLILTHRRLLVSQFTRDLTTEGYAERFTDAIDAGMEPLRDNPITIQTYAWFARHAAEISRSAYQLVICDEAHTALGEKTSAAIRSFSEPIYIGMTATEQLIAKQVSDVFPASVDDLPLADAARRGLIAPLRCLRVPPAAAINSVPIVGGDFEERALAAALDHSALNQAAASLYRERFGTTPGIVYAAGVEHAYNLAQEFRAAGIKAEAVSGKTPPVKLAETLAAYERGEINVLINAQLLAEGWNSPRATVCFHLAPTASRRVYQQRIGRIMRMHSRKEAGIVVDFVTKGSTHNDRVISLHSLLDADFYREGATGHAGAPASPAAAGPPAALAGSVARSGHARRRPQARRDPARVAARRPEVPGRRRAALLGHDRRPPDPVRPAHRLRPQVHRGPRGQGSARDVPRGVCGGEPQPAPADDGPRRPRRDAGRAGRLRRPRHPRQPGAAVGEGPLGRRAHPPPGRRRGQGNAPDQILARWTWKLARATRKVQDRRASAEFPEAKRLLGAVANSRGHRHEDNVAKLVQVSRALPLAVGAALLASADGYTPRANALLDQAREDLGPIQEIATALAENLPAPKAPVRKSRRRRKKRRPAGAAAAAAGGENANGEAAGCGDRGSPRPTPTALLRRHRQRRPSQPLRPSLPPRPFGRQPLVRGRRVVVALVAVAQEARQLRGE